MNLKKITDFVTGVVAIFALPPLIYYNFSSIPFFLNEWHTPILIIGFIIIISSLVYFFNREKLPSLLGFFILLFIFIAMCLSVLYNPYPESLVSISGLYNEKDGSWVSTNTDENANDIIFQIEDTWNNATAKENPLFQFSKPFSIDNWQFPTLFLTHLSQEDIINLAIDKSRSTITLVGFTRNNKITSLYYNLNNSHLSPNEHSVKKENQWFNNFFKKIISNPTINEKQKREIIAKTIFIDFNTRSLNARRDEMTPIGMGDLVEKTKDEIIELQKKYPFVGDELNYLISGLFAAFATIYNDLSNDEAIAELFIEALSFYPYFPYSSKESFQRAYIKKSYANWGLTDECSEDEFLLDHLVQITYNMKDSNKKNKIIKKFNDVILNSNLSPIIFYYYLEMIKTEKELLNIPLDEIDTIIKLENLTDKYLLEHPGISDDFIELKSIMLYSVYYTWHLKYNRIEDVSRIIKKIGDITNKKSNIKLFIERIAENVNENQ